VTGLVQGGDVIGPPRPAWTVTVFVPLPDAVGWQTRGGSPPAYLTGVIPIRRRPLVG
jgi:hypothetical protein